MCLWLYILHTYLKMFYWRMYIKANKYLIRKYIQQIACHDIVEILLRLALNTNQSINQPTNRYTTQCNKINVRGNSIQKQNQNPVNMKSKINNRMKDLITRIPTKLCDNRYSRSVGFP